ncbi:hypothetical protein H2203_003801 [Taxawa tesnikishii (nom. ined.)]|nr:hypothetical protein H2203_003801 [Dothideales sp. JES 119]
MGSHWKFGAHQDWMLVEGNSLMASRPSSIPSEAAAVISIVVRTAADALLNIMEIPFKSLNYAGTPSNSVNPIVTTASARNHQALKELGAHHVFDYSDKNVVSDIQGALEAAEGPLRYVFDAVCSSGELSSTQRCDALRTSPDALFVGTLPVQSTQRKWGWCLATRARDMPLPEPIGFVPANPVWERRLLEVMSWAAENYERGFRIPKVTVVEEEAKAIESIQASGEGKIRFEKIALKHPLRA